MDKSRNMYHQALKRSTVIRVVLVFCDGDGCNHAADDDHRSIGRRPELAAEIMTRGSK
jgi:hypothetical protein